VAESNTAVTWDWKTHSSQLRTKKCIKKPNSETLQLQLQWPNKV